MSRWLAALLLVALLPWQSLTWAAEGAGKDHSQHASHAVAHWLGTAHHHHEDGSLHVDDSEESLRHLQADSPLNSLTVLPAPHAWVFGPPPASGPPDSVPILHPAPFLEGVRRPPRALG